MSDILGIIAADNAARALKHDKLVRAQVAREDAARAAVQAAYEARSPKQKHDDEIAGHVRWIANPKTASYFWMAVKDGAVMREWDDMCDCDDRADFDPNGHTKKIAEWPAAPFTLLAYPIATVQVLPGAADLAEAGHAFAIAVGDVPIWEHRVRWFHYADGSPDTEEDALVFGVRRADGTETVTTVDHDGVMMAHSSRAEALAHVK